MSEAWPVQYGHAEEVQDHQDVKSNRWLLTVWVEKFEAGWDPDFVYRHNDRDIAYYVWQLEACPGTGRRHWHVYCRTHKRKLWTTIASWFSKKVHVERARGTEQQCRDYVTKEESRVSVGQEHGEFKPAEGKQGRRSDLEAIHTELKAGATIYEIAETHPSDMIRYHAGIKTLSQLVKGRAPFERDVKVYVLWGTTNEGKSHRVMHAFPDCYIVDTGRDPFGGYDGEETVFFEEFEERHWTIQRMNRILDKWRLYLDARYINRPAFFTRVIINLNQDPMELYRNEPPPLLAAFRRRIMNRCFYISSREMTFDEVVATQPTMPRTTPPALPQN